jgi:hypothetical protein
LKPWFHKEPKAIQVRSSVGGIPEAIPDILSALGRRLPDDIQKIKQVPQMPLEELILELTNPQMVEIDGKLRAQATAKLKYIPSEQGKDAVECDELFLFTSPMGPIEADDLKWYLERYYLWPHGVFKGRAKDVEADLSKMGTGTL